MYCLQKAEKCAVRLALKLEKAGFSESRLWHLLKDNQKGIQGFYDEMKTAVLSSVIEVDRDAKKPKVSLTGRVEGGGGVGCYFCCDPIVTNGLSLTYVYSSPKGLYIVKCPPPQGGGISANVVWGTKYEKAKRKRGKM